MRLNSLVSLIGAKLLNTPSISQITTITTDPTKVQRGNLFIALNPNDIPIAVQRGAYGVIFSGWAQMSDMEIAWIRTEDIEKTLIQLIRFFLIQNSIILFNASYLERELASAVIHDERLAIAFEDYEEILRSVQNPLTQIMLVDKELAQRLSFDYTPLPSPKSFKIVQSYLFESSILCEGNFFERIPISPLFAHKLEKVLGLSFTYMLHFDLYHPKDFSHFRPIFVDHYFRLCEFGKSERVLIIEPECQLFQKERDYLNKAAPWAKKLFTSFSCPAEERYNSLDELKNILYNRSFQLALIEGDLHDFTFLEKTPKTNTLF